MIKSLAKLLLARRFAELKRRVDFYSSVHSADQIRAIQLDRFNQSWKRCIETIPFYREWRKKYRLPGEIQALDDIDEFPILTKKIISEESDLIAQSPGKKWNTLTGGTSGLSTAFPMGDSDADAAWVNTHVGRAWNSLQPGDRLFMIWGHSHLFSGPGAGFKQFKRKLKDKLNNIKRVSAYNLDESRLEAIASELLKDRPAYVIGYGSCLGQLCGYLRAQGRTLIGAEVKRVVNTSETLEESKAAVISSIFGCPVINEYGMAEAGVIGYSSGSLYPIRVFWNDYVVRSIDRRLIVTTIGRRCFPLINYDPEDLSSDVTPESGSITSITNLQGKVRDIFEIEDLHGNKHEVSVIIFDHIFKQIESLALLHYELTEKGDILIKYTSNSGKLNHDQLRDHFGSEMKKEGIEIDKFRVGFEWLELPLQTTAGKRLSFVRKG